MSAGLFRSFPRPAGRFPGMLEHSEEILVPGK